MGSVAQWLGEGGRKMAECSMEAPDLVHARTMTYDLECNWKVFNDNYLVGWDQIPLNVILGRLLRQVAESFGCATANVGLAKHVSSQE